MEAPLLTPDRLAHVLEHIQVVLTQLKCELADFYGDKLQKLIFSVLTREAIATLNQISMLCRLSLAR